MSTVQKKGDFNHMDWWWTPIESYSWLQGQENVIKCGLGVCQSKVCCSYVPRATCNRRRG